MESNIVVLAANNIIGWYTGSAQFYDEIDSSSPLLQVLCALGGTTEAVIQDDEIAFREQMGAMFVLLVSAANGFGPECVESFLTGAITPIQDDHNTLIATSQLAHAIGLLHGHSVHVDPNDEVRKTMFIQTWVAAGMCMNQLINALDQNFDVIAATAWNKCQSTHLDGTNK